MLSKYIEQLLTGKTLDVADSYEVAQALFTEADPVTSSTLLSLLHEKGESVEQLLGFHQALSDTCRKVELNTSFVDIVGTGGDKAHSLNISTGGALLAAACGVPILKHGNRSVSSKCGSADVLEELGFNLNLSNAEINAELSQNNFAFCFAPNFYPVLAKLSNVRKKLGFPTIFNLLGPLLNPGGLNHVILGVYDPKYVDIVAEALLLLGTVRSLVFCANGLDELSCLGPINAKLVEKTGISDLIINPKELGLNPANMADLAGGERLYNAQMLQRTLNGQKTGLSDSLILNAAVALYLYGKVPEIKDGVIVADRRLVQGNIVKLNKLQEIIARKYQAPVKRKSMKAALIGKKFAVISEIKRGSPSVGRIAEITNPVERAQLYIKSGAVAISVLTDAGFSGSMDDLRNVSSALQDTSVPVLCKDFMLTPPQIVEAYNAGADVILLIVHVLKENTISMAKFAHSFGLEVLVEVHTALELEIALLADADIIGVNQRDLTDFSMHPEQFADLIKLIPKNKVKIAESGLKTREQALAVLDLGYDGMLVGEALSRLNDPQEFFND